MLGYENKTIVENDLKLKMDEYSNIPDADDIQSRVVLIVCLIFDVNSTSS